MDHKEQEKAAGWDAISDALFELYPEQEPVHFAPEQSYADGGDLPLDGISVYVNEDAQFYHYISYGFSELYEKETDNPEVSGFGFELSFRLHYDHLDDDCPEWPVDLLQEIAAFVFDNGLGFNEFHTLPCGRIGDDPGSHIRALMFVRDPELGHIATDFGAVKFLNMYGLTQNEYDDIRSKAIDRRDFVRERSAIDPLLTTDLGRH